MNSYRAYRCITAALQPFLPAYLAWRKRCGKENAVRLCERLGYGSVPRPEGMLLWIHAVSVGESAAALPLLEEIHAARPKIGLLMTTGTVTSARLMAQRLPKEAMHQFAPVDAPKAAARFLRHWQPDVGVWVESELWPNLVIQAYRRGCRLCLVNGRMSERSFRAWRRFPGLIRRMFFCFSFIAAQSEADAARFNALGGQAESFGNLKYDTGMLPVDPAALVAFDAESKGRPRWLAASTHPGEEEIAAEVHRALQANFPTLLTLIAPRHPERGGEIAQSLARQGFNTQLRSLSPELQPETEIYIADTLGELGLWYRACRIAFVGGSLVPHGGQNMLEPARLSCAILHGPHMHNFLEIAEGLDAAGGARKIHNAEELASTVREWLRDPQTATSLGVRARIWTADKAGVNARLLEKLLPLIDEACRARA